MKVHGRSDLYGVPSPWNEKKVFSSAKSTEYQGKDYQTPTRKLESERRSESRYNEVSKERR